MKYTAEQAYNEDCRRQAFYHDGMKRRTWESLPDYIKATWERDPTPNTYAKGDQIAFNTPREVQP